MHIFNLHLKIFSVAHNLQSRMYHFLLRSDIFFKWSQLGKRNTKSIEILHRFSENVIAERRSELEKMKIDETLQNTNDDEQDNNDLGIKKKKAFLDVLLQSTGTDGKPLTNIDIREEVDTFMFEVLISLILNYHIKYMYLMFNILYI